MFIIWTVWYPDNIPRLDRAKELDNDISLIQQRVTELNDNIEVSEDRLAAGVDEILEARNIMNEDQLQSKLFDALSLQEQKTFQDVITIYFSWKILG